MYQRKITITTTNSSFLFNLFNKKTKLDAFLNTFSIIVMVKFYLLNLLKQIVKENPKRNLISPEISLLR